MYILQASLCYKRKLAALRKGPINMANKKMSTAELVGISHFSRNGLMTKRYGEAVYFIVQPNNISVLSESSIAIKINHLMQLLSQQPDIEIICSDARENFEFNQLSLASKAV